MLKNTVHKLNDIGQIVDWEIFRSILMQAYKNKTRKGGRPEIDVYSHVQSLNNPIWFI
jgi:hypothetical protein